MSASSSDAPSELACVGVDFQTEAKAIRERIAADRRPMPTNTRPVTSTLANLAASDIMTPEDAAYAIKVADADDETIAALAVSDKRGAWAAAEDIPRPCNVEHKVELAMQLGIAEPGNSAILTDWVDINDSLRHHLMMQSLIPHKARGSVHADAITHQVHQALGSERDAHGVDPKAGIEYLKNKYGDLDQLALRHSRTTPGRALQQTASESMEPGSGSNPLPLAGAPEIDDEMRRFAETLRQLPPPS